MGAYEHQGMTSLDPDQNDLAIFDLQVTLILPVKFQVDWPFCSEEVQNRFRPQLISNQNKFS